MRQWALVVLVAACGEKTEDPYCAEQRTVIANQLESNRELPAIAPKSPAVPPTNDPVVDRMWSAVRELNDASLARYNAERESHEQLGTLLEAAETAWRTNAPNKKAAADAARDFQIKAHDEREKEFQAVAEKVVNELDAVAKQADATANAQGLDQFLDIAKKQLALSRKRPVISYSRMVDDYFTGTTKCQ
ncbi:MAG TPA: hypothetical protein VMJ10_04760 [Kofleriaceae bacterium]|nr:hypothetical protein [Kofleriaceae bacterium]